MDIIFLDNNATTPVLPEVVSAMLFDLDGTPKNPSSITHYGRQAKEKIIESRKTLANYLGILSEEVYFTSGGTESNHMLIRGFHERFKGPIVSTRIEHASVLGALLPYKPVFLPVDSSGAPNLRDIEKALLEIRPAFLVLSGANTETGVLLPLEEVASLALHYKTPLVLDGVGLLGKVPAFPLPKGVAAASFSGHKLHGPKGIGISVIRKEYRIPPLLTGGHQERGMRAGTENLSGILGLAKAISLIDKNAFKEMETLRNYFEEALFRAFPSIQINGEGKRLPNTSNLYFPGVDAETLLLQLDQKGVIASLGSACSSGTLEPSHVLINMGFSKERALSSLRFSLSKLTTKALIDRALGILIDLLHKL